MIEVTNEMKQALTNIQHGYQLISCEGGVKLVFNDSFLEKALTRIIELHEQSKPKPEPVAYKVCNPAGCVLVESRKSAEKLSSEYGNGTYQPLYTAPPTREPLCEDEIKDIIEDVLPRGTILDDLIRAIEQSHGIGGEQ